MANFNGTKDADILVGTAEDDNIRGRDGDDVIDGGAGDDTLWGGKGLDCFIFDDQSGNDEIKDFDLLEDTIDLSAAGVTSLADLTVTAGTGNSVVISFGGNSITLAGLSVADVASINFDFAPAGPEFVQLGVDDIYTDAADGTDQLIDGDGAGEGLEDTDTFVYSGNSGDDTITDFQINTLLLPDFIIVPGDQLDLSALGLVRTDLGQAGLTLEQFFAQAGATFTPVGVDGDLDGQLDDTLLTFADGSTLTLLGVDEEDLVVVVETNLAP